MSEGSISTNPPIDRSKYIVTPGLKLYVEAFERLCKVHISKPIMLVGPTGCGKSLFLHIFKKIYSEVNNFASLEEIQKKITTANCAHFQPGLARNELFGHVKGAYSGAYTDKKGLISKANGGVLILEEIGTLPEEVQAMLLTFIETGKYYRVGGLNEESSDVVQIIGATNSEQELREDFRYRFIPFNVPPIYERREDILFLLSYKYPNVINELRPWEVMTLLSYYWPGNTREIERLGGLIEQNIKLKKVSRRKYKVVASPKHLYSFPFDNVDEYFHAITTSNIFGVEQNQTQLNVFLAGQLYVKLVNYNEKYAKIFDKALINMHLGICPRQKRPAFNTTLKKFKESIREFSKGPDSFITLPSFNLESNLEYDKKYDVNYFNTETNYSRAFIIAYAGLCSFSNHFYKNVFSSNNILDFESEKHVFPHLRDQFEWQLKRNVRNRLHDEILAFLSGIPKTDIKVFSDSISTHRKRLTNLHIRFSNNAFLNDLFNKEPSYNDIEYTTDIQSMDLHSLQKYYYEELLKRTDGNIAETARIAGIPRTTLDSQIKKLGIKKEDFSNFRQRRLSDLQEDTILE